MNDVTEPSSHSATSSESSVEVEQAEQQILGDAAYQKAEVVHRFADTHPWFHPTLIVGGFVVVCGVMFWVWRRTSQ